MAATAATSREHGVHERTGLLRGYPPEMIIDERRRLRFRHGFYGTGRASLVESVLSAERFGYDTFLLSDHLSEQLSPIRTLAVVAELSETFRVAPWILGNDFHIPEVVARELATIGALSGDDSTPVWVQIGRAPTGCSHTSRKPLDPSSNSCSHDQQGRKVEGSHV